MSSDPRPHTAYLPNGKLDLDTERRFGELFRRMDYIFGELSQALSEQGRNQLSITERLEVIEAKLERLAERMKALEAKQP